MPSSTTPTAPAPAVKGRSLATDPAGRVARIRQASTLVTGTRLRKLLGLTLPLVVWEAYARTAANRLTPTVGTIVAELQTLLVTGDLWFHGRLTLFRGFLGLAIAIAVGVLIGFAMARSRWVDAALQPFLAGVYPIPKLALYPIVILLFGLGGTAKVWQVALECFFPIAYNAYAGASQIDRDLLRFARNAGAGSARITRDLVFPAALPAVLTGVRIATPIMLIVITVTELLGESRGLGFLITDAQANFQPARALAVVLVLGLLGFVFDRFIVWLTRRLVFWERSVAL